MKVSLFRRRVAQAQNGSETHIIGSIYIQLVTVLFRFTLKIHKVFLYCRVTWSVTRDSPSATLYSDFLMHLYS